MRGLGGVGKSELAAHWAATGPHRCRLVRWFTADSAAAVQNPLGDLATALQPALAAALPPDALAEFGLQWLAAHREWLVVLDNVTGPADIAPLIARADRGRFLITSRLAAGWNHCVTTIHLDVLAPEESYDLLAGILADRDLDGAFELCAELGQLPFALVQSTAYLEQNPLLPPVATRA
ncbi:hypothetical protein RVR_9698 [Actinacidiphila reveromycinica]|uniref:NB-ARC domain-containing protein n=1 Tax=Actinacidiphila reveromycinica TaxID=659352 RepID=A0A7U3UXE3_9ACTN|nr:hypothetical protein [Streptomyces sp. SN-593]BBB02016.1 hypothetical protein RVR_9698 [Streptomyces sp. SN-593]